MGSLRNEKCVACNRDAPRVTDEEMAELRPQIPDWEIVVQDGIPRLTRTYTFKDFVQALAFTNRVGELAEAEDHHPDLHLAWGKVAIEIWTHKIDGLTESDFIWAAKADRLLEA